jgi:hypothetical protein
MSSAGVIIAAIIATAADGVTVYSTTREQAGGKIRSREARCQ